MAIVVLAIVWDATRDKAVDDRAGLKKREQMVQALESSQRELAAKIQSRMGKGRCNTEADCRVVGLGAKICDRYLNFLFYSMIDSDDEGLRGAVDSFNRNQNKLVDLSLAVPHCGDPMPAVTCNQGHCVDPARIPKEAEKAEE